MNHHLLRPGRWLASCLAVLALACTAATALAQEADLSLLKTGPDTASPGATVSYDVSLVNVGPDTATAVALSEPISPDMNFVSFVQHTGPALSCTLPAVGSTGSVDCTLATLASGAAITYTLTLQIGAGVAPGTSLMSIGTVSNEVPDPHVENDAGVAGTFVLGAASSDVSISKSAPATVAAGVDFKYRLTVTNAGPAAAADVSVSDDLPASVSFVALTQLSGPTFNCTTPAVGSSGNITCLNANFAVASAVFELTVHVASNLPSGTVIENSAAVQTKSDDGNPENNMATATTRIEVADLTLGKTAPATVARGANLSFELTLTNAGPDAATAVTLFDALPAATTFVSFQQNSGPSMVCTLPAIGAGGTVSCGSTLFASGAVATFTLTVATTTAGNATSQAMAAAESADPTPAGAYGASVSASTAVLAPPDASMAFAPGVAGPGQASSLNVTLSNPAINSVALDGIAFNLTLPSGLTLTSAAVATCGGTLTTTAPGTLTLTGASLAVGGNCQFAVNVTSGTTGTYLVTSAPVSSTNGGTGSTANATLLAALAPLIAQTISPNNLLLGSTTTLTLTLSNPNAVSLSGVGFGDTLPAGLAIAGTPAVVNGCGGTVSAPAGGGSLSATAITLAANASCTIAVQLVATAPGLWSNAATVNAAGIGPGNTALAAVTVYIVVPALDAPALWLLTIMMLVAGAACARRALRRQAATMRR